MRHGFDGLFFFFSIPCQRVAQQPVDNAPAVRGAVDGQRVLDY